VIGSGRGHTTTRMALMQVDDIQRKTPLKEIPHNARGPLAGEYQPLAACKNLDYPPGNLRFLQFAID